MHMAHGTRLHCLSWNYTDILNTTHFLSLCQLVRRPLMWHSCLFAGCTLAVTECLMCARYVRWRRNGRGRRKLRQPELHAGHSRKFYSRLLLLPPFPNLGPAHRVFNLHVLWSCACFSFMSSCSVTPPQFRPPYLSASTHFHVLITTSSSVFLSTWPNQVSLASLIFSLMFATPAIALISSFLIFSILFIAVSSILDTVFDCAKREK